MKLLQDRSFLGIGLPDPQASLHVHYQEDPSSCGTIIVPHGEKDSTSIRNPLGKKLLQLTTPETGARDYNGFSIYSNFAKDIAFRQQEQANFFIEGPGGGLTIAPNGNVGIGTQTALRAKLDVNGSFHAQSANITGNTGLPKQFCTPR
jgi:hypothetical protein